MNLMKILGDSWNEQIWAVLSTLSHIQFRSDCRNAKVKHTLNVQNCPAQWCNNTGLFAGANCPHWMLSLETRSTSQQPFSSGVYTAALERLQRRSSYEWVLMRFPWVSWPIGMRHDLFPTEAREVPHEHLGDVWLAPRWQSHHAQQNTIGLAVPLCLGGLSFLCCTWGPKD